MSMALIGYSGFVGGTLMRQASFEGLFRSTNSDQMRGEAFDSVVCAGAPAQKWLANAEPEADGQAIDRLIENLDALRCEDFTLISTVDVFREPIGVTEDTPIETEGLHAYGLNRYRLEQFVAERFSRSLIVRLPGLVGPGLKKNIVFDFQHGNNLDAIDSRGVFQFYPMVNLWFDILEAKQNDIRLLHLAAEPVSVEEVARLGFGFEFENHAVENPARYDVQTSHVAASSPNPYQYSKRDTLQAVRSYAQGASLSAKGI